MTTQPHAIPSKQDELAGLYDQELEAMWDEPLPCFKCQGPGSHVIGHISCMTLVVCDDHAKRVRKFIEHVRGTGQTFECIDCGAKPLGADDFLVVPL